MVSPDILPTISPVFPSLSKNAISCFNSALKYKFLILADCRSPRRTKKEEKNKTKSILDYIEIYYLKYRTGRQHAIWNDSINSMTSEIAGLRSERTCLTAYKAVRLNKSFRMR
ncbi:hypothetical protein M5K25_014640 [Dendrobium thyrsiflorum]|uniref:Uncharacterized protein n=1 Tax=Dendrobium thyrsiflorum TaxID=117978 RepID=A0ABD0UNT9_DENTH